MPRVKKKYIVVAGEVISIVDGERQFLSTHKLCSLYGVDPDDCIFADERRPETLRGLPEDLPHLKVRQDGEYRL